MLTRPNYSVTNVQGLADLTKDQATLVKQTMDKTGSDTKDFLIALLNELESVAGAENIGITETIAGSGTNVKERAEWLKSQIDSVALGQVPLGSLTDEYLSNEAGQLKSVVSAHLAESATYDFQQFDKDTTTGMYFRFEEYRADSTLFRKTVLSNPDVNGYPQTETQTRYGDDGTAVLSTKTFTLVFDADGLLVSRDEVV